MNRELVLLLAAVILFFGGTLLVKHSLSGPPAAAPAAITAAGPVPAVERIISLAPSATEMIFFLGLQRKLVGVTMYCTHPPEARAITQVGGYATPDFERIVMLKPDLVVMVKEHASAGLADKFAQLGIEILMTDTSSVDGIIASLRLIGQRCRAARDGSRPVILVTVGRNMGSSGLKSVFAAGPGTFYNDLIVMAGGINGCPDTAQDYVDLSGEALIRLNPDIIIDIVPDLPDGQKADVQALWRSIPGLKAPAAGNAAVLTGDYVARPGVGFLKLLGDMAAVVGQWELSTR